MIKINEKLLSEVSPMIYFLRVWQKRIFRLIYWFVNKNKYANLRYDLKYEHRYIKHSSKLLRNYIDSDQMYLWQRNKVINLNIAIKCINGVIIKSGEIFSFCKLVGRPTSAKGYVEGMELSKGKARPGIGGGICQLSNLLHWMVLHTEMVIIDRSNHSFDPFPDKDRVLPFGSGAAIFWNYVDLQFQNTSEDRIFQIVVYLTDDQLKGEIRCNKPPVYNYHIIEKNHRFTKYRNEYYRHNEIWRRIEHVGINGRPPEFIKEELVIVNHSKTKYIPNLNIINNIVYEDKMA